MTKTHLKFNESLFANLCTYNQLLKPRHQVLTCRFTTVQIYVSDIYTCNKLFKLTEVGETQQIGQKNTHPLPESSTSLVKKIRIHVMYNHMTVFVDCFEDAEYL